MTVDNKYGFQYFPSDFGLWDPKIANSHDKNSMFTTANHIIRITAATA